MRIQKEIKLSRNYPETGFTGIELIKLDLLRDHYDVELSECQTINETHLGRVDGLVSKDDCKR